MKHPDDVSSHPGAPDPGVGIIVTFESYSSSGSGVGSGSESVSGPIRIILFEIFPIPNSYSNEDSCFTLCHCVLIT